MIFLNKVVLNSVTLFFILFGMFEHLGATVYFASPKGLDTNTGTITAPFQTIQKAADIMIAGDTCYIRTGTYRETIIPANSGSTANPVVFAAYRDERVIVSGTDILNGSWDKYKDNIYTAKMDWTLGSGKDMVFVDGIPVIQARHPNDHTTSSGRIPAPLGLPPLWMTYGNFTVHYDTSLISNPTDLNQNQEDYWKGAIYAGWNGWSWCMQSAVVESSRRGSISVTNKSSRFWFPVKKWKFRKQFRWFHQGYLTNHLNALDKPAEWHWQDNKLYLWLHNSGNPKQHVVEVKRRHLAFDLRNKDYITLKGIRIFASSVSMYNANKCIIDGCRMSFVSHFTWFDDNRDGYIDDYKVQSGNGAPQRGEVGVYVGGKDNVIKNSVIKYSAGAGVILGGYRTTLTNSIVHDCGYAGTYMGCIFITYNPAAKWEEPRGGHTITHNDIYRSGRALIHLASDQLNHGDEQTVYEAMDIGYNRLHDACLNANDGGAFNSWRTTLGSGSSRTQIHHNLVYDLWSYFWNSLIYPDNNTFNLDIHNNIIWHSSRANVWQAHSFNYFYHHNPPGDPNYSESNVEKINYDEGVSGLKSSDYPGGYFKTGPTIQDEEDEWY